MNCPQPSATVRAHPIALSILLLCATACMHPAQRDAAQAPPGDAGEPQEAQVNGNGEHAAADARAALEAPDGQPIELDANWREADRMLEALGGRENWARLAAIELHGNTYLEYSDIPVPVSVWRDLEKGRVRIEQTFEGTKTTYVIDENGGWRQTGDTFAEMTPGQIATVHYEQARTPYRIFRSLARREGVRPRQVQNGLEVYTEGEDGEFLCWIELGPEGRPRRYGYSSDDGSADREVFFDYWSDSGGYLHPTHYSESSRALRFENKSFLPHTELPPQLFEAPR